MTDAGVQAVTRIKLRELERQRDRLHALYAQVEARAAAAGSPAERVRALAEGLKGARFARQPIHPEAENLDALFFQIDHGTPAADVVDVWLRRLERELDQGRLRAEFAYAASRTSASGPAPSSPPRRRAASRRPTTPPPGRCCGTERRRPATPASSPASPPTTKRPSPASGPRSAATARARRSTPPPPTRSRRCCPP